MKGDFSKWGLSPADNYSGVLHQQGRVLLDQDWNAAQQIQALWRETAGKDIVGDGLVAVPAAASGSFRLVHAKATANAVTVLMNKGRGWVDGQLLQYDGDGHLIAEYMQPPFQDPPFTPASIAAGVRDAVILEVWDEAISAFQLPKQLLEPALGGPDTTERVKTSMALRLWRLADGEDCGDLNLNDNFKNKGRLTVTPSPINVIAGPCPVPDSGGYNGFEHALYRIEIATPQAGVARFKWSQFNGGLVGRGQYAPIDAVSGTVTITANTQMIDQCGLDSFYLEAMAFDPAYGHWRIVLTASATLSAANTLSLTGVDGVWPTDDKGKPIGFFRLWNAIERIDAYPTGLMLANELSNKVGIRLAFDAPTSGAYTPGDYWTFPARVAGTEFDPVTWPNEAPPQGIVYHRAPLGVLEWTAAPPTEVPTEDTLIHDCRQIFLPLARVKGCCTVTVGDGKHSFGQYRTIRAAINALPAQGGTVCVLAGTYDESVRIHERMNIRIHGCGPRTIVRAVLDKDNTPLPAFEVTDSSGIAIEDMAIESGPRSAVHIENADHVEVRRCLIQMRDVTTVWQSIYSRGDDVVIEDNAIEVQAPREGFNPGVLICPRGLPPKQGNVGAPVDPKSPEAPVYLATQTRGGIQIAGGSDRVRIAGNIIRGGLWNGITLGSLSEIGGRPGEDIPDIPPDPDECDPCKPADLSDGGEQTGGRPRYASAGDLYDIEIVSNRITDMGINGIGVVRYFDLANGGDVITVHGLHIADNLITRCLRRELADIKSGMLLLIGYGGISLAAVTDLRILRNEIITNGISHRFPVCGVFALMVQGLQLDENRIIDNGPRNDEPVEGSRPGIRGGVHIWILMPEIEVMAGKGQYGAARAKKARKTFDAANATIRDNIIIAPLGRSLTCFALGPVMVSRNRLVTQGTTGEGLDLIAASVLIGNLGISNEWTLGLLAMLALLMIGGYKFAAANFDDICLYATWLGLADFTKQPPRPWPPLSRRWATGKLAISDNQITLDVSDQPQGFAFSSLLAFSLDDVALTDNQIEVTSTEHYFYAANLVLGGSVRVSDNRMAETWMRSLYSGFSFGLMNTTTDNQTTQCLRARALKSSMRVFRDNISLVEAFCPNRCDYEDRRES